MNIQNIIGKIKCCYAILISKQYYAAITTETYPNGNPLVTKVITNIKDTQTARKKLIKNLKEEVKSAKMYAKENKMRGLLG